jgi:hypothetical protein
MVLAVRHGGVRLAEVVREVKGLKHQVAAQAVTTRLRLRAAS